MKIDFSKIIITDVAGNEVKADIKYNLCNQMHMQGDIKDFTLAHKLYNSQEPVELSDEEVAIIRKYTAQWSHALRAAVDGGITKD